MRSRRTLAAVTTSTTCRGAGHTSRMVRLLPGSRSGLTLRTNSTAAAAQNEGGGRSIYLDMQATTPVDPRVLDAMLPAYTEAYGNPHSRTHHYGWETLDLVEEAREVRTTHTSMPWPGLLLVRRARAHCPLLPQKVAKLIGADAKEIIFTSGATESNNAAIKGVARFYGEKRKHIITTVTVHLPVPSVRDHARMLT